MNLVKLLYREEEREMNALCADQGVGLIPWSPLARGRLARGKSSPGPTSRSQTDRFGKLLYGSTEDADGRVLERLDAMAKARGVPPAQIALAWLLRQKGVAAPILGATKMQHLEDAVAALSLRLDKAELQALEEPYQPHPILGHS